MLYELTFGEEQQQLIKLKVGEEKKDAMLGSAVFRLPFCSHF